MSDDITDAINRIRGKLTAKAIAFKPVSREEVEAFETEHGIALPEGYRRFVLEIGNGGEKFYDIVPLGRVPRHFHRRAEDEFARLANPFPFTKFWVWEAEDSPDEARMEQVGDGRLILGDQGCGIYWALIVTGPQRGQMWHLTGEGIQPCAPPRDFLSWYEYWLDGHSDWWADFVWPSDHR
jgi:SMI1 / KNR4 family (SUKH-1)